MGGEGTTTRHVIPWLENFNISPKTPLKPGGREMVDPEASTMQHQVGF